MKILSISTSSNICAVAVLDDNKLLKEATINNGYTHSVNLMPMIKELLSQLNITLEDIDLIVCDKGPGSFTGIRIGIATTKAFSDSLNIKAIGISSLEALAYNVKESEVICTIIDAKNNNVYSSIFENTGEQYIVSRKFDFENIFDLLEDLKKCEYKITFVGDGAVKYKNDILKYLPASNFSLDNDLSAYNLGLAGYNHYLEEKFDDVLPLYLRKSQAELNKKI